MPQTINCPKCNRQLRVANHLLGKKVKCPNCANAFTAVLSPAEDEEPDFEVLEDDPTAKEGINEPEEDFEVVDDQPPHRPTRKSSRSRPAGPPEERFQEEVSPSQRRRAPSEDDEPQELPVDESGEVPRIRRRRPRRRVGAYQEARSTVAAPAITLMAVAGLSIAVYLVDALLRFLLGIAVGDQMLVGGRGVRAGHPAYVAGQICATVWMIAWWAVVAWNAWKMLSLDSLWAAKAAAIMAMIPCGGICCIAGIPVGIWALIVLGNPKVQDAFG